MRILYILPYIPWPIKVTCYNLIPRLAQRHEVHLLCLADRKADSRELQLFIDVCKSMRVIPHSKARSVGNALLSLPTTTPLRVAYCHNRELTNAVTETIQSIRPDVICVERWRALQYLPSDCRIPTICHPIDSMTLYNGRLMKAGAWWEKLVGFLEYVKFLRYEGVLARKPKVSVFCSNIDLEVVRRAAPDARLEIVPNGVDCDSYFLKKESEEEPDTIVFTGSFLYRPNQHAIDLFLRKILPDIRRVVPAARLLVVGKGAKDFFARKPHASGIDVHDFVPDLRRFIARGTVAVAPMTVGSGVSCKVLEAFSTGTPVVTTRLACGDLPVVDGEHLLLGEEPANFAEKVSLLLGNSELRRKLRNNARRLVQDNYDWEKVTHRLESILLEFQRRPQDARDSLVETPQLASAIEN